jgi:hypothetical protein
MIYDDGNIVSARSTNVVTDLEDESMWSVSEDFESQFASYKRPALDATSEKVKKAKMELAPKKIDTRGRSTGIQVLTAGRTETPMRAPKISPECSTFNMSPAMAQRIYDDETKD